MDKTAILANVVEGLTAIALCGEVFPPGELELPPSVGSGGPPPVICVRCRHIAALWDQIKRLRRGGR